MSTVMFDKSNPLTIPEGYRMYVVVDRIDAEPVIYIGKKLHFDLYSKEDMCEAFKIEAGVIECKDGLYETSNGVVFDPLDIDDQVWKWLENGYDFVEFDDWIPFSYEG